MVMTSLITTTIAIKPKMTHEMKCKVSCSSQITIHHSWVTIYRIMCWKGTCTVYTHRYSRVHVYIYTYTHTCTNNTKNQDKLRQNRPIAGFKGTQKPVKIARSSRLIKQFPNRRGTLQKRGDSEKDLSPLDFKWKCGQDWRTSRIQVEKCKSIKKKMKEAALTPIQTTVRATDAKYVQLQRKSSWTLSQLSQGKRWDTPWTFWLTQSDDFGHSQTQLT